MTKLALFLGLATVAVMTGLLLSSDSGADVGVYEAEFAKFNALHGKKYSSMADRALRFEIFKANFDLISAHNADSTASYTLEVNKFADLTFDEFKAFYLSEMPAGRHQKEHCAEGVVRGDKPDAVDWNKEGKVQKVKNQAACGSCWAFSAVGAIESAIAIGKKVDLPDLAEQELVDCSTDYGNGGCNGGFMHWGFNYVLDNNITAGADYEYTAEDGECRTEEIGKGKFEINGCVKADPSIDGLAEAIAVNPTSVAFAVQNDFRFYKEGVYNPASCPGQINHGVLAFGYDSKAQIPYYFVKNSWGTNWGDKGLFKISFGKGRGTCSIAGNGYNYYPVA